MQGTKKSGKGEKSLKMNEAFRYDVKRMILVLYKNRFR